MLFRSNVNVKNKSGKTVLHLIAQNSWLGYLYSHITAPKLVQWLIDQGADVNAKDNMGNTALHLSAHYGIQEMISALIDLEADVNAKNNNGKTVLCYAYDSANWEQLTQWLKDNGAK